jgi:peptidoglycan/LPS O-acetylase OafA/YrhL
MEIINNNFIEQNNYIRAKRKVRALKGFYTHLVVYVIINIFILINIYVDSVGNNEIYWEFETFSVMFFWGIGLLFHAFNVFGLNLIFGKDWEEQKIKEFMNKNNKQ